MPMKFIWNDQESLESLENRKLKWDVFIVFYILENRLNFFFIYI